jgi:mannosyl-oligosaccharide alpha-1,2-mannosidase
MEDYGSSSKLQRNNEAGPGSKFGEPVEKGKEGLWVNQIEKWVKNGKRGDVPPGVPAPGQSFEKVEDPRDRDYQATRNEYLLRPEVWAFSIDP